MTVYKLSLPNPSDLLIEQVKNFVIDAPLVVDNKEWLDDFHNNTINSPLHLFSYVPELDLSVQNEFGKYFPGHELRTVVGIMKNPNPTGSVCSQPPHIDRARALAINFYIDLGGDKVTTSFYNHQMPTNLTQAYNYHYGEFELLEQHVFDLNTWYAYNVFQCHSIENIQSTRYFVSLVIGDSLESFTLDDLLKINTFEKQLI